MQNNISLVESLILQSASSMMQSSHQIHIIQSEEESQSFLEL